MHTSVKSLLKKYLLKVKKFLKINIMKKLFYCIKKLTKSFSITKEEVLRKRKYAYKRKKKISFFIITKNLKKLFNIQILKKKKKIFKKKKKI